MISAPAIASMIISATQLLLASLLSLIIVDDAFYADELFGGDAANELQ